jgi:hypothetical protein
MNKKNESAPSAHRLTGKRKEETTNIVTFDAKIVCPTDHRRQYHIGVTLNSLAL